MILKRSVCFFLLIAFSYNVLSQKARKEINLKYKSSYIFPANQKIDRTRIGGLSGIDFYNDNYYIVVDDYKKPRVLLSEIIVKADTIHAINFTKQITIDTKKLKTFGDTFLDLESIVVDEKGLIVSNEGSIKKEKNPGVYIVDSLGNFIDKFQIPNKFLAKSKGKPFHNGVFEGLSKSYDRKGYWVAMEFPLKIDGEKPTFKNNNSPVRITYYNKETLKPIKEFAYQLSKISRREKGKVNLNGLTDILEYEKDSFIIMERTYQSGYKNQENIVKIYKATIKENTTDILDIKSIRKQKIIPLEKELLLDLSILKHKIGVLDNIEGITFGPTLSNGNKSLILVADDNFQKYGKQFNQFILLEINNK